MAGATIEFQFDSTADEERFLRKYLTDAWERFEAADHWTTGWYWSYRAFAGYDCGPDGGLVRLVFEGDPDGLRSAESDRWETFDGLADWTLRRYEEEGYDSLLEQQREAKGEVGGEWEYRLKPLLSRFSLAYLETFEDAIPSVGEGDGENPIGIGFWVVLHDTMVQCGYDWYDETEACLKAMENRLKSIGAYRGASAARDEYERVLSEWEAHGEELAEWLAENPTGEAQEP
ncbi:MAG: hypothetical protein ABEH88_01385 [Halobacteriales archaeon]